MKLSILGTGHVGLITGLCFAKLGHEVLCVDNAQEKIQNLQRGIPTIYEPGLEELLRDMLAAKRVSFSPSIQAGVEFGSVIFMTVGTPPMETGAPDLSFVESVAREIAHHLREYRVIVEKSTVPVQTGERIEKVLHRYVPPSLPFDVASNPEFLREGSAIHDALVPDRLVIGVNSDRARAVMTELYQPFTCPKIFTDVKSAELIKHAANSFLAMKISYINAVAEICERVGADVTEVARGMGLDKRIGESFLNAGVGYGGSCFPKDVEAFIKISEDWGFDFTLLKAVQQINQRQREDLIKKIEEELWILKDKTVGILGLSFKPNTDDIREAPSIYIIQKLLQKGAHLQVYDPQAMEQVRQLYGGEQIIYSSSLYEAARETDCLVVLTEWEEFKRMDLLKIKSLVRHPLVVDGRNLFQPKALQELGFTYRSVGR